MNSKKIFAIDLGGTNAKLGILDSKFNLLEQERIPTDYQAGPEANSEIWAKKAMTWSKKHELYLVGIGSPGPLDTSTGKIIETPNLANWSGFSFTEYLSQKLKLPTFIENDANCAALGEWHFAKVPNLVMLTLGTGIGSGVINDNSLIRGMGFATEAGHMTIDLNGPICNCGKRGCFEAICGSPHLIDSAIKNSLPVKNPKDLFDLAKSGQTKPKQIVDSWIKALAIGTGNLINIFNPNKLVFAGGLSHGLESFWDTFRFYLERESFQTPLKICSVEISKNQETVGIIGAGLWAEKCFSLSPQAKSY